MNVNDELRMLLLASIVIKNLHQRAIAHFSVHSDSAPEVDRLRSSPLDSRWHENKFLFDDDKTCENTCQALFIQEY